MRSVAFATIVLVLVLSACRTAGPDVAYCPMDRPDDWTPDPMAVRVAACDVGADGQVTLRGVVFHPPTGDPLIGASLLVQARRVGAATDLDGAFELGGLHPTDTLEVAYVSHRTQRHLVGRLASHHCPPASPRPAR